MLDLITPFIGKFPTGESGFMNNTEQILNLALDSGHLEWAQEYANELMEPGNEHHWLTKESAYSALEKAASVVEKGEIEVYSKLGWLNFRRFPKHSNLVADIASLVREWLGASPTDNQIIVGAAVLLEHGKGEDAWWWGKLEPGVAAYQCWAGIFAILRRRLWFRPTLGQDKE